MTDEQNADQGDQGSESPNTEPTPEPRASEFTSGEGLVAFGGIVILANFVIFEMVFREYFITPALLLMAVGVTLLPRLRRDSVEKVHRLDVIMKVLGYGIAVLGVFEILDDIRFDGYDDFGSVIAALIAYAGYAIAYLGARSIKT